MLRKPVLAALATALLVTSAAGCATILGGSPETLTISLEEPVSDAEIVITGLNNGERFVKRGPNTVVQLSRSTDYQITVKAAGYQTEDVIIRRNIRSLFWLNICCGGIVGLVVDYATGNMYEHDRTSVSVRLEPVRKSFYGDYSVIPLVFTNLTTHAQYVMEVKAVKTAR